jgi:hypothetical protein
LRGLEQVPDLAFETRAADTGWLRRRRRGARLSPGDRLLGGDLALEGFPLVVAVKPRATQVLVVEAVEPVEAAGHSAAPTKGSKLKWSSFTALTPWAWKGPPDACRASAARITLPSVADVVERAREMAFCRRTTTLGACSAAHAGAPAPPSSARRPLRCLKGGASLPPDFRESSH